MSGTGEFENRLEREQKLVEALASVVGPDGGSVHEWEQALGNLKSHMHKIVRRRELKAGDVERILAEGDGEGILGLAQNPTFSAEDVKRYSDLALIMVGYRKFDGRAQRRAIAKWKTLVSVDARK